MRKVCFLAALLLVLLMPVAALCAEAIPAMDVSLAELAGGEVTAAAPGQADTGTAPFIPETGVDKAIVGIDNRTHITNRNQYPYSAVAYLEVKNACGCASMSTGFMVSPNAMVTAAHCLVCTEHGEIAEQVTAYFGYQNKKNYMLKYDGPMDYWCGTYFDDGDGTHSYAYDHMLWDFAFVRLQENVGEKTGWFGLDAKDDASVTSEPFEVTGYRGEAMTTSTGYVDVRNEYLLTHKIDTLAGNSGGPVFNGQNYVSAIIVAEAASGEYNTARRITSDILRQMRQLGLIQ